MKNEIKKLEVGKTYTVREVFTYKVLARTAKMITINVNNDIVKRRIFILDNCEAFRPLGSGSMAPILTSEDIVEETPAVEEIKIETKTEGTDFKIVETKKPVKHNTRFEIYTKHPLTKETGWSIKWVDVPHKKAKALETIKTFPDFDCIITTNDYSINVGDLFEFNGKTIKFDGTTHRI